MSGMSISKTIFVKILSIKPTADVTGYTNVRVTDTLGNIFSVELDGDINVGDEVDICVYDTDWSHRFARVIQNRTQMAIIKEFVARNHQKTK